MTIGWVYEDDMERFFEATERPPSGLMIRSVLHCPFCAAVTSSSRELLDHLHAAHSARRPTLLIEGREPGHLDSVRTRVSADGVQLLDCEHMEIGVDGAAPSAATRARLITLLQQEGSRTLTVRLVNAGADGRRRTDEEYTLRVNLPSDQVLAAADREFVATFGVGAPHISSIETFVQRAQGPGAAEYVEGLADYVRGVLIKDRDRRTGISAGRDEWSAAYKHGLDILLPRQRPLPKLLCGLMRFALNDFSAWSVETGFPDLDRALNLLGPLTDGAHPSKPSPSRRSGNATGVCPVDAGVSRVLELAARCVGLTRWSLQDEEELRLLARSNVLSAFDRAKVRAIWACSALRLSDAHAADEPLRASLGSDCFGSWASEVLEGARIV